MTAIDPTRPVALRRDPTKTGDVRGAINDGYAFVRFHDGSGACNYPVDELEQTTAEPGASKAWPPAGLETKVPGQAEQK